MPVELVSDDAVLRPGDVAFVVALAALDLFGRQLCELVFRFGAQAAWERVRAGEPGINAPDEVVARWRRRANAIDPERFLDAHIEAGVGVSVLGSSSYPAGLVDDPEAPLVLFHRGDPDARTGPRVAIVGTRRASGYGRDVARSFAQTLGEAGVAVVSGLALGIDAAAHEGASRSPTQPIGVVGSGLDVVYPKRNAGLWRDVSERGLLLTEYPLGTAPAAAHFPARNRIIAALADVVVVVESHDAGGSLLTVAEANRRHRTVLSVPGSIFSPASRGTNALVRDGAGVALGVEDVLLALGQSEGVRRSSRERRLPPDDVGRCVLDAFGWQPATLPTLASRSGYPLGTTAGALEALTDAGWVRRSGAWFERIAGDRTTSSRSNSHAARE